MLEAVEVRVEDFFIFCATSIADACLAVWQWYRSRGAVIDTSTLLRFGSASQVDFRELSRDFEPALHILKFTSPIHFWPPL